MNDMSAVLNRLQEKVDALEKERDTLRAQVEQMREALEKARHKYRLWYGHSLDDLKDMPTPYDKALAAHRKEHGP